MAQRWSTKTMMDMLIPHGAAMTATTPTPTSIPGPLKLPATVSTPIATGATIPDLLPPAAAPQWGGWLSGSPRDKKHRFRRVADIDGALAEIRNTFEAARRPVGPVRTGRRRSGVLLDVRIPE